MYLPCKSIVARGLKLDLAHSLIEQWVTAPDQILRKSPSLKPMTEPEEHVSGSTWQDNNS